MRRIVNRITITYNLSVVMGRIPPAVAIKCKTSSDDDDLQNVKLMKLSGKQNDFSWWSVEVTTLKGYFNILPTLKEACPRKMKS